MFRNKLRCAIVFNFRQSVKWAEKKRTEWVNQNKSEKSYPLKFRMGYINYMRYDLFVRRKKQGWIVAWHTSQTIFQTSHEAHVTYFSHTREGSERKKSWICDRKMENNTVPFVKRNDKWTNYLALKKCGILYVDIKTWKIKCSNGTKNNENNTHRTNISARARTRPNHILS